MSSVSRLALSFALVLVCAGVLDVPGAGAGLAPAASGTFTMTSEPGDYIGDGQSYSYEADVLNVGVTPGGEATVSVRDGGFGVNLGAPDGQPLSEGTYEGAARFPDAGQPAIDVSGEGRGCNKTFGNFTVHDVEYGPHGYLQSLHATFEQHCEEPTAPALRGEVDVTAAPLPELLEVDVTFAADRTTLDPVTGLYALQGSIECSQEVSATVLVEVREVGREGNGLGSNGSSVACSPTATDWQVTVGSSNNIPFTPGALEVEIRGEARDDYYSGYTGEHVYGRDEASERSEVAGSGSEAAPEETTGDAVAEAAASEASDGLTGFIARDPALSLLLWFASLVAVVLVTALVTLLVHRRRSSPGTGPSSPT